MHEQNLGRGYGGTAKELFVDDCHHQHLVINLCIQEESHMILVCTPISGPVLDYCFIAKMWGRFGRIMGYL